MKLSSLLKEQVIKLKPIQSGESMYGNAYTSKFVKSPTKFFEILVDPLNNVIGEVEYGDVDDNTFEILSIHINKEHRGKNFGAQTANALVNTLHKKRVILMASPTSRKFWKRLGFEPMSNVTGYFTKTY
jgi:RimJ/RimL family protein N-acetyltransferase